MTRQCTEEAVYISDVLETTILYEKAYIPPVDTVYSCQVFELPQSDQDYHIIAAEPVIDNLNAVHHIVIYGVPDYLGMWWNSDKILPKEWSTLSNFTSSTGDWSLQ